LLARLPDERLAQLDWLVGREMTAGHHKGRLRHRDRMGRPPFFERKAATGHQIRLEVSLGSSVTA